MDAHVIVATGIRDQVANLYDGRLTPSEIRAAKLALYRFAENYAVQMKALDENFNRMEFSILSEVDVRV